jgi:exonuclease III
MNMKIISHNVRGLGGAAKKKDVSQLFRKNNSGMLYVQKTKIAEMDKKTMCRLMGRKTFYV